MLKKIKQRPEIDAYSIQQLLENVIKNFSAMRIGEKEEQLSLQPFYDQFNDIKSRLEQGEYGDTLEQSDFDTIAFFIQANVTEGVKRVEKNRLIHVNMLQERYNQKIAGYLKEDGTIDVDEVVKTLK